MSLNNTHASQLTAERNFVKFVGHLPREAKLKRFTTSSPIFEKKYMRQSKMVISSQRMGGIQTNFTKKQTFHNLMCHEKQPT
jgi:hypothetical protein